MGRAETRRHLAAQYDKETLDDPILQARLRRNLKAKNKQRAMRSVSKIQTENLSPNQAAKLEHPAKRRRGRPRKNPQS
jgi:hypothetical protein